MEAVKPAIGAHPKDSGLIFKDGLNRVVAEAAGIIRVVPVMNESLRAWVEAVEASSRADPQVAIAIYENLMDGIVAQAVWIVGIVLVTGKPSALRIEFIKTALCTYP